MMAVTAGGTLGFAAWWADRTLEVQLAAAARAEAAAVVETFRAEGPAAAAALVEAELAVSPQQLMLLEGPRGARLAGNAQGWPPTLPTPSDWREMELFREGSDQAARFGLVAVRLDSRHRLLVGHSLTDRVRLLQGFGDALLGGLSVAMVLAAAGAWALSRFLSVRVSAVAEAARAVAAGDFRRRVPVDGSSDAFDELAGAINAMLTRIEQLMEEMRIVTDTLAHDLRSPLTRIRARIERAAGADGPALREALSGITADTESLLRLITLALEISRAEAGLGREHLVPIDLAPLLSDLVEMYVPLAEDAGITLTAELPETLVHHAHRELLSQAVANLIDNALRHSGAAAIKVVLRHAGGGAEIVVADDGRGIAEADRERALHRFSRLDAARSTPGSGLGLSLAAAVVRQHGGVLRLEDAAPGLRVVLSLPLGGF